MLLAIVSFGVEAIHYLVPEKVRPEADSLEGDDYEDYVSKTSRHVCSDETPGIVQ